MPRGTLKGGFEDRGFTFVSLDRDIGQGDVFLHLSHIAAGEDPGRYVRGAQIDFEVEVVKKGGEEKLQARDARLLADLAAPSPSSTISARDHEGAVKFWSPLSYGRDGSATPLKVSSWLPGFRAARTGWSLRPAARLTWGVQIRLAGQ